MNLRPHHLLCIQKFTGHGYDAAFTEHMTALVAALRANPGAEITLVHGCDYLCARCPNNECGACSTLEKVDAMDSALLFVCGLEYGDRAAWSRLSGLARERIFEKEYFAKICQSCQWFNLCKETPANP